MLQNSKLNLDSINPRLEPFKILIGDWETEGHHRLLPDTTFHGHTTFSWLEGGAFLMMYSRMDELEIPDNISIIASDDAANKFYMFSYDVRGVSRKFEVKFTDNTLEMWRNFPGFSQRFKGVIKNNGNITEGVWELCEDDINWNKDLELTYKRIG